MEKYLVLATFVGSIIALLFAVITRKDACCASARALL